MGVPSIKGVALQFLLDTIEQRIAEGRIDRAAFESMLGDEELKIIDSEILPGLWYPIESYGRMLELALKMEGRPREQWAEAGFEAAQSVLSNEAYGRLVEDAAKRGKRSGFALMHVVPLFLNFSSWSYEQDPGDGSVYHVNVTQAESLPRALVALLEGVMSYLSQRVRGNRLKVSSERLGPDRILFRAV
jgi:hypothetical protein